MRCQIAFVPFLAVVLLGACSSSSGDKGSPSQRGSRDGGGAGGLSPDDGGTPGSGGAATASTGGSASGGRVGSDGSSPLDAGDTCSSCDDGFPCTLDSCVGGSCRHTIGPSEGATACPAGEYCTLENGCVRSPACATDADCEAAWAGDACKANPRCDPMSAVCLFDLLDRDGDGHPPQICGGDDCDDSDWERHPAHVERCDGKDNNCNGEADEAGAGLCDAGHRCVEGVCECLPENLCGDDCVADFATDFMHCGGCGRGCFGGGDCVNGVCSCDDAVGVGPDPQACADDVGTVCVDLSDNRSHCGTCGNACSVDQICLDGVCTRVCPDRTVCAPDQVCLYYFDDPYTRSECVPDPCLGATVECSCAASICPWFVPVCEVDRFTGGTVRCLTQ